MYANKITKETIQQKLKGQDEVHQKKMVSYLDAFKMMTESIQPLKPRMAGLSEISGKTLAEDVFAPVDLPSFDQSAMDGYAFRYSGFLRSPSFIIAGESAAGKPFDNQIEPQSAIRIFTGAAIPKGTDTVVAQEKTMSGLSHISILDQNLLRGLNIRKRGSEIRKGDLALKSGTKLSPAAVGFLGSLGISEVLVYPEPKIGLVITGNEFHQAGESGSLGKIFESNGATITSALQTSGCTQVNIYYSKDEPAQLSDTIREALVDADLVITTGGVSVGKYDYAANAFVDAGVQKKWHTVNIRPGKPVFFGLHNSKPVFGLPGNPAAALICYYAFVHPAIQIQMSKPMIHSQMTLPLAADFEKKNGCTQFLHAFTDGNTITIQDAQQSYRLSGFSGANAIVILDENQRVYCKGETVRLWLIPE